MSLELKKKIKQRDINVKSILGIYKYSFNGLKVYAKDGKSVIIYIACVLFNVIVGLLVGISLIEWLFIIFMMVTTLAMELMNTAVEATCDCITKEYNDFIKMAKDCGSAATFVLAGITFISSLIIYLVHIF